MYYLRLFVLLIMLFFCAGVLTAQKSYNVLMSEGNTLFEKNKYDAAASKFIEATKQKKQDYDSHYNLGNALYKGKKYEEAKAEYEKANQLAKTSSDKASALHNLGNTYMQMNQPEKAADFYKQSLKQEPYNEATRKNFEIAKLKQKENQQKQNQKENQKNGKDNEEGKESKNQKDQDGGEQNKDNPKTGGQGNQQEKGKGNDGEKPSEDNKGSLPKELQNAILNRSSEREKETARRILNKESYSMPESNEKDW